MAVMHCVPCSVEWDADNTGLDVRNCWVCGQRGEYGYWRDGEFNAPLGGSASWNADRAAAEEAA